MTDVRDRYLADRVMTATPEQLIKLLLDRAVVELAQAQETLTSGDRLAASPHLRRAQDIVAELRCCLDFDAGPIATQLDSLYDHVWSELVEAALDGDQRHVHNAASVLAPVQDAWNQACCGATSS